MKRILIFISMLLVSVHSQAGLNSDINCMALYVGLGVGFEKKGKHKESEVVQLAAKSRFLIVSSQIGRDEAMYRMKKTKFWKQRYADAEFWREAKRCLQEDGISTKGLD